MFLIYHAGRDSWRFTLFNAQYVILCKFCIRVGLRLIKLFLLPLCMHKRDVENRYAQNQRQLEKALKKAELQPLAF